MVLTQLLVESIMKIYIEERFYKEWKAENTTFSFLTFLNFLISFLEFQN